MKNSLVLFSLLITLLAPADVLISSAHAGVEDMLLMNEEGASGEVELTLVKIEETVPDCSEPEHLRENLRSIDVQLTAAEVAELDAAPSKLTVDGGRMNEMQMKVVE